MASLDDCINSGEASLNALYGLQTAAMKAGDLATQKALKDDIGSLTDRLTQLRRQDIEDNDKQINILNTQLGLVTAAAQNAQDNLHELSDVLSEVVTAVHTLDGILGAIAGA